MMRTDTTPSALSALSAPAGVRVRIEPDPRRLGWLLIAETGEVTTARAHLSDALLEAAEDNVAQLAADQLARRVLGYSARARYPHRPRTANVLQRLGQVRAFLAADPDDPAPAGWPCVLTETEARAVWGAAKHLSGGLFEVGAGGGFGERYAGPAWDLEARKREVAGARFLGWWCGIALVADPVWSPSA